MDVEATCRAVANARVYFERIDLHPLAVALSFVQTVADKRVGFGASRAHPSIHPSIQLASPNHNHNQQN